MSCGFIDCREVRHQDDCPSTCDSCAHRLARHESKCESCDCPKPIPFGASV